MSIALKYPKTLHSYNPIPKGCVLYLPLWALKGSAFKSVDAYKHTATVTTATWQPNGRNFVAATPDYIELAAESVMNFTSGDFSIVVRIKIDDLTNNPVVCCRGLFNTDGYYLQAFSNGRVHCLTNQGAAQQSSGSSLLSVAINNSYTLGASRVGASIKIFINGVDDTNIVGAHTNPATSARTMKIGTYDNKVTSPFDGIIQNVLVYNRSLSAGEHLDIHNRLSWRV